MSTVNCTLHIWKMSHIIKSTALHDDLSRMLYICCDKDETWNDFTHWNKKKMPGRKELCYSRDAWLHLVFGSRSSSISCSNVSLMWLQTLQKFHTLSSGMPKGDTWLWNTLFFVKCALSNWRCQPWWHECHKCNTWFSHTYISHLQVSISNNKSNCDCNSIAIRECPNIHIPNIQFSVCHVAAMCKISIIGAHEHSVVVVL